MSAILSVTNLTKSFGSHSVLHNVSFEIQSGSIVGLVGPNGAGKSTIMKAILGLINYQSGKIKLNGRLVSPTSHQLLEHVGALIEYPGIYPFLSGWDHLTMFANSKQAVTEIVSELKMTGYIHQKAKHYSLGMKQKLGIALALVNHPQLVVLDEPMNGLDPQSIKDLRDLILSMAKHGTTFLISSHILSELAKLVDSLIIINQGQIIKQTTMTQLLNKDTHYIDLQTNDDQRARFLIRDAGYELVNGPALRVIQTGPDQLSKLIQLMATNNIEVLDIQHENGNLEHSLLTLLTAK